jgi:hypothetical protein
MTPRECKVDGAVDGEVGFTVGSEESKDFLRAYIPTAAA